MNIQEHANPVTYDQLPIEVQQAARVAHAKNANDLLVLDLRDSSAFTDWFVICSGRNCRQVKAVADAVEHALVSRRVKPKHVEGSTKANWILLDYFDFVVHVFVQEYLEFYSLERLWGHAKPVTISESDLTSEMSNLHIKTAETNCI